MRRLFIAMLIFFLPACAPVQSSKTVQDVNAKAGQMRDLAAPRTVSIVPGQYLGAQVVPRSDRQLPPLFAERVTLRATASLVDLAAQAGSVMGLRVRVEQDWGAEKNEPRLSSESAIAYSGSFQGLLDQLAAQSGMDWEYVSDTKEVVFSQTRTRTFTLMTAPGAVRYEASTTNQSNGQDAGGAAALGVGQPVSNQSSDVQTKQSSQTSYKADAWDDAAKGVAGLLSPTGRVVTNIAAGTLTVTDTAAAMRRVAEYMDRINAKLSRQVALTVKVWALEVADNAEAGVNLQAAFSDGRIGVATSSGTPYSTLGGAGSVTATVLDRNFSGSTAMLQALQTLGKTTLVTSGTGVTTSGQPLPLQVLDTDTYLASISTDTTDTSQITTMVPGKESTGFSMTILPHILDQRRVILECNISLSSLDRLDEYESGTARIQLPKVSTRSFSQRVNMRMGQTLVLAGFEKTRRTDSRGASLLGLGMSAQMTKTILVLTLDVENVGS